MSLIKCPKCGKKISDKSKSCVHCGKSLKTENKEKIRKSSDKKKILILSIIILIILIVSFVVFFTNNKTENESLEEILSEYTWVSDDKFNIKLNFDNFEDVESGEFYSSADCMLYTDYIDKNRLVEKESCLASFDKEKNSIKLSTVFNGRRLNQSEFEYNLTYNPKLNELTIITDNGDEVILKKEPKEDISIPEEPYFKTYNITNKYKSQKATLDLYRDNYCEISFKDFEKTRSIGRSNYLLVTYNDGECTYEKVGDLDFIIRYKGTFSTNINTPGLNKPQNNYVFQTENQEMKITFDDKKYKDFTITNGEYDMINEAIYFKSK